MSAEEFVLWYYGRILKHASNLPEIRGLVAVALGGLNPWLRVTLTATSLLMTASSGWCVQTGQWNFNGNHNDSVGTNTGTFVGTETYTIGFLNQAVSLNGSSYLNLGSNVISTSAYTKAAWIRRTGGGGNNNIFSGNDSSSRHAFWVPSGTGFQLAAGHNGAWTTVQDNVAIATNVWTHVAVTYDSTQNGGTLRLYRNGRLAGGIAVATNVAPPNGGAALIGAFDNANNFTGQLDDVRLWNHALTAAEIGQVCKSGMQSRYAVYSLVPEAADYEVVYELAIPTTNSLGTTGTAAYAFDNSDAFTNGLSFDRVAYYLALGPSSGTPQWVYASMDPFTRIAKRIGVPSVATGASFQQQLSNLNVRAGGIALTAGTNIQTGNIEFWGYNYAQANGAGVPGASASVYDFGDTLDTGGTYGSMQIHNYGATQTLFAYNRWGSGGNSDLGIGNRAATDTDWTFAQNAATYTNRLLLVLVRPQNIPVFTALPKPLQLYPRDLATGLATVRVEGCVVSAGWTQIVISVSRAGAAYTNMVQPLTYNGGSASFAFSVPIIAELAGYDFQVFVTQNGTNTLVASANDVVAGDAFLINGQSNAEARSYNGSANVNQSTWIRSFGFHSANGIMVQNDPDWHLAEGDAAEGAGAVGQWGLRLGRVLVDSNSVPVALINQALGGQPISYFQCNDSDPANPAINYGQMLYRVRQAGLTNAVRGILWYQGEAENGNATVHENGWLELYRHWLRDFPSVEKVYVCQLHVGCGVTQWTAQLRDRQRRWADSYDNIEVLSTTGLPGHDGCHYSYAGYQLLGEQLARLVRRDLYGVAQPSQIAPPNVEAAYLSDASGNKVTIVTRNPQDHLTLNNGAGSDFRLEGGGNLPNAQVLSATVSNNTIQLTFNADARPATGISYSGHTGGTPFLTNALGLGLLSFHNLPILSSLVTPSVPVGLQTIPVCSNRMDLAWATTTNASHYLVRRDGVVIGSAYETRFMDVTAQTGVTYNYEIAAFSPAGTSSWSSAVSGVTVAHNIYANVPEASDYDILYQLDLAGDHQAGSALDVAYSINNAASYTRPFQRVAYYLELQDQPGTPLRWVYVAMNPFTNHPAHLGVPVAAKGRTFQTPIQDMTVFASSNSGIVTGQHLTTGNLEFWGHNYSEANAAAVPNASGSTYDHGDQFNIGGTYGSMQIHNSDLDGPGPGTSAQVLFAYNHWGDAGIDDVGIGNATSGVNPDWTFLANAQTWNVKRLYVLVRPITPVPFTYTINGDQLHLTWPVANPGWRLQTQTNAPGTGLGTNWFTVASSSATNQIFVLINPANGSVFFRLVYP